MNSRDAELLDEVLPRHQRGLRGERVVARGLERVERVRRDRVALAEEADIGVADERRALAVGRAASTSEPEHEALVPPGSVPESSARVRVEHPDRVDAAIDHALLRAHDERDGFTVDRRGREVGGRVIGSSSGFTEPSVDWYEYVTLLGASQSSSSGAPRPASSVLHTHGSRCGPEKTGPFFEWLMTVRVTDVVACRRHDLVLAVVQAVDEPAPGLTGADELRTHVVAVARHRSRPPQPGPRA